MTYRNNSEGISEKERPARKIDVRAAYLLLIRAYLRHENNKPDHRQKAAL